MTLAKRSAAVLAVLTLTAVGANIATGTAAGAKQPAPPGKATKIRVRAGHTVTGISERLPRTRANGLLTGSFVVGPGHAAAYGSSMVIYDADGRQVDALPIWDKGKFSVYLTPSKRGYTVCDKDLASHSDRPTGAPICLGGASWSLRSKPADAQLVPLRAGQHVHLGRITMPVSGEIRGRVHDARGKLLTSWETIRSVSDPSYVRHVISYPGREIYRVDGLPPSPKGFVVCFSNYAYRPAGSGDYPTGYEGNCGGVQWNGRVQSIPKNAPAVQVASGQTVKVPGVLRPAGAVSGSVVRPNLKGAALNTDVWVFDRHNHVVPTVGGDVSTRTKYSVEGIPPGHSYQFCAAPNNWPAPQLSLFGQCYGGGRWEQGQPPSGKFVRITRGHTTTGINFHLAPAASISGTVRKPNGSLDAPARAYLYTAGGRLVQTDGIGAYSDTSQFHFRALKPGRYVVCVRDRGTQQIKGGSPRPAPACHGSAAWDGPMASLPSKAKRVRVTGAQHVSGIDVTLKPGGAITGTATDPVKGSRLAGSLVYLYKANGTFLRERRLRDMYQGPHAYSPRYLFTGVPMSKTGYLICFPGDVISGRHSPFEHGGRCWRNVAWRRS